MKKYEIHILILCFIGYFFQLLSNVRVDGENDSYAPIYWAIGSLLVILTLSMYAKLKGYGIWLGLLGFLSIYGIVFLIFMPYKMKPENQPEKHWLFNAQTTSFCFILSLVLFIYSMGTAPSWEMNFTVMMQSIFFYPFSFSPLAVSFYSTQNTNVSSHMIKVTGGNS